MKETWRGWQGHFCCECKFHLNTLLEHNGNKVVVSTVGNWCPLPIGKQEDIGYKRAFETMVFGVGDNDWDDIDPTLEMNFFAGYKDEKKAQNGHYKMIEQVKEWMVEGVS